MCEKINIKAFWVGFAGLGETPVRAVADHSASVKLPNPLPYVLCDLKNEGFGAAGFLEI